MVANLTQLKEKYEGNTVEIRSTEKIIDYKEVGKILNNGEVLYTDGTIGRLDDIIGLNGKYIA